MNNTICWALCVCDWKNVNVIIWISDYPRLQTKLVAYEQNCEWKKIIWNRGTNEINTFSSSEFSRLYKRFAFWEIAWLCIRLHSHTNTHHYRNVSKSRIGISHKLGFSLASQISLPVKLWPQFRPLIKYLDIVPRMLLLPIEQITKFFMKLTCQRILIYFI